MKVEFILSTGFAGAVHRDIIDIPDDYSDDDIEEYYQDWKNGYIDGSWTILEDNSNES